MKLYIIIMQQKEKLQEDEYKQNISKDKTLEI